MFDLVEGTYATGNGAFRAGRDFTPRPGPDSSDSEAETGAEELPCDFDASVIDPQLLDETQV